MEEKKNGLVIPVIIVIVLLLGLIGYICYDKFFSKETVKVAEKETSRKNTIQYYGVYDKLLNDKLPKIMCGTPSELYQESGLSVDTMGNELLYKWLFEVINVPYNEGNGENYYVSNIDYVLDGLVYKHQKFTLNSLIDASKDISDLNFNDGKKHYNLGQTYEWTINDDDTINIKNYAMDCLFSGVFKRNIIIV